MNSKLFVGNLAFSVTESDLLTLFSQYGAVADAKLIMDRVTQKPRGFAFVTMQTVDDANAAAKALNGTQFQGRNLVVNEARPPQERPRFEERRPPRGDDRRGGGGSGGDKRRSWQR